MKHDGHFATLLNDTVNLSQFSLDVLDDRVEAIFNALSSDPVLGPLVEDKINGGIAGRKVEPVFYVVNFSSANSSIQQEMCARFTEDNKTFAVLTNLTAEVLLPCLAARDTVLLQEDTAVGDQEDFEKFAGHYYAPAWFNQTLNANSYVDGLVAQGFLKKENRIGLIRWDNPSFARAGKVVAARLAHYGLKLSEEAAWQGLADPSSASGAVLKFKTSGVDRVLALDYHANIMFTFAPQAESQRYRPRYGLNSFSQWDFIVKNVPAEQLEGAVGVGHRPLEDTDSRDHNESIKRCFKIYRDAGLTIRSASAGRYTVAYCDLLLFLKTNLEGERGVNSAVLRNRIGSLGSAYESPLTFGTTFSPGGLGGPTAHRAASYDAACGCFRYTGGLTTVA